MDLWFVFATLGEMNLKEIIAECQNQGWIPILVLRQNELTIIPCFDSQEKSIKFARRNLSKDQLFGTTLLTDSDLEKLKSEWVDGKGYKVELFNYPRLVKDISKIDIEIFEYTNRPDVYGVWGNKNKILK